MATFAEVVSLVALNTGVSEADARRVCERFTSEIIKGLKMGDTVFTPLGSFYVGQHKARSGRNPRTGATIAIPAKQAPKLRFRDAVKDALN